MKTISLLFLFVFILFASCSHKIYLDGDFLIDGIEAWNEDYEIINNENEADLVIKWVTHAEMNNQYGNYAGVHCKENGKSVIYISLNNKYHDQREINVIAHEFGHYLGYNHNNDLNSIMYGSIINKEMDLSWFKEFD